MCLVFVLFCCLFPKRQTVQTKTKKCLWFPHLQFILFFFSWHWWQAVWVFLWLFLVLVGFFTLLTCTAAHDAHVYTVLITQQLNKTLTTHSLIQAVLATASKNCKWNWRISVAVLLSMLAITSLQTTKYGKSGTCSSMLSTGRPCNCACAENDFFIYVT